jgi:hypothetical protein
MRRRIRALSVLLAATLVLAACASVVRPQPPCKPVIVTQVVTQTVAVPAQLTSACLKAKRRSNMVEDVVDALNRDEDTIDACNKRFGLIRSLPASSSSVSN